MDQVIVGKIVNTHGIKGELKVKSSREAMAEMSAAYFKYPANELTVVGITGTAGKTSTSTILKKMIEENGEKAGLIGTIGAFIGKRKITLHNTTPENYDIQKRVYLAEINLSKLTKYARENKKYTEVPKFPAVERDIAIIVDENVEVGKIEKVITKKAKKILESAKLFDIFRNEKIGENKKSVAYSLSFRDKSKTLSDDEVNQTMENIISELEKEFNAELRK